MFEKFQNSFDEQIKLWATIACEEWGFSQPSDDFFVQLKERLPKGLLATIGFGIENGIVLIKGCTFQIESMGRLKGPYNWFSRDNINQKLNLNWEYFIQVAEYVRLSQAFKNENYILTFEDSLMDIGVYRNNKLLVCCEIKEKSSQAKKLVSGIKEYEKEIDLTIPDRGNDPLRKAKYLIHQRPLFFYLVAIGIRYEFNISFPE